MSAERQLEIEKLRFQVEKLVEKIEVLVTQEELEAYQGSKEKLALAKGLLLTQTDARDILRCSPPTMRVYVEKGFLPKPLQVVGKNAIFYDKAAVLKLRALQKERAMAEEPPLVNLHLQKEDFSIPSTWWAQARVIKEKLSDLGLKGVTGLRRKTN